MIKKWIMLSLLCFLSLTSTVKANELIKVKATAYCLKGTCADGSPVREGIVAYRPEDIGKTMAMYDSNMNFLGYFEITDTGSESIRSGRVVDVWVSNYEYAVEYGVKEVFIQVIDSDG